MARIDELEERISSIEHARIDKLVSVDKASETTIRFESSSYYVDVDVTVVSNILPHIEVMLNGVSYSYDSNFVSERLLTKRVNELIVRVNMEGLLSKKIKIEGIGVKLLNA